MAQAQEAAATALRELAEHDRLTGAANRELLSRRLPDFVTGPQGLLVYIDLDGFKKLNDTHGHHIGDAVLCAVTERLARRVRESDTIARVGGDEFVVLLNGCSPADAPAVAQRILDDMCEPITDGPLTVQVGASVGVVVLEHPLQVHDPQEVAEDVMRSADAAMYDVKRRGGGVHVVAYAEPVALAAPAGSPLVPAEEPLLP
nr:GGDEF domain-containing protein [Kineosporia babensis]